MPLLDLLLGGGVAVTLIGVLGKYLEYRWTQKKFTPKTSAKVIKAIADIYQHMNKAISHEGIDRVVILKAENGGGKPKVGGVIYISAIMEVHKNSPSQILQDYQRLRADSNYVELLSDLLSKYKVDLNVDEIKTSLLKTICEAEGIKYSEFHYLYATDEALYFCNFSSFSELNPLNSEVRLAIEVATSQISEIFKNNL